MLIDAAMLVKAHQRISMGQPFDTSQFCTSELLGALDWNATTLRSWKRRGLTSPIGIAATGERGNYSLFECVLLFLAKRMMDSGFEARAAFSAAGECSAALRQFMADEEMSVWIVITNEAGDGGPTIFTASSKDELLTLLAAMMDCAWVIDVAKLVAQTRQRVVAQG